MDFFSSVFLFFSSSIFSARILTLTLTLGHYLTPAPPPPPPDSPQKVNGPSLIIRCKERHAIALQSKKLPTQEFIMASFPSIQITEGEWTSGKYWDILGVKLVTFFTDNPALLADYISNFETRPDDVFVVSYPKSGSCFL